MGGGLPSERPPMLVGRDPGAVADLSLNCELMGKERGRERMSRVLKVDN